MWIFFQQTFCPLCSWVILDYLQVCFVKCVTKIEHKNKFFVKLQDSATEMFGKLTQTFRDLSPFLDTRFLVVQGILGWLRDWKTNITLVDGSLHKLWKICLSLDLKLRIVVICVGNKSQRQGLLIASFILVDVRDGLPAYEELNVFVRYYNYITVIVVGNGYGDTSSNPGRSWLHLI